jgi:hypothetical protein
MLDIEWQREPRRILVSAIALAPFPITDLTGIDVKALVDTGSSVSGVARGVAEALNLKGLGKRPLTSAQGEGQVERYAFRIGFWPCRDDSSEPRFPFVFDEVIGIELTNAFQFTALIGMDILSRCDFEMRRDVSCRLAFGP